MGKKHLTDEQVKKYVREGGVKCPYCKSPDITGGSVAVDANRAWREVDCQQCGRNWTDLYRLIDVVEVEEV